MWSVDWVDVLHHFSSSTFKIEGCSMSWSNQRWGRNFGLHYCGSNIEETWGWEKGICALENSIVDLDMEDQSSEDPTW